MSLVLANESKARLLDQERSYLNNCVVKLFTNNYTPVATMTSASFSPPPTDAGLAVAKSVNFAAAVLNGSFQGELLGIALTWTAAGDGIPATVYGYWIHDTVLDKVILAERRTPPDVISIAGQTHTVVLRKQMDTM